MQEIYNLLIKKIDKNRVLRKEPMSKHTSFRIGGPADLFVKAEKIEELKYILEIVKEYSIPLTVIGNGTNLLVKDRRDKRYCSKNMFERNWDRR